VRYECSSRCTSKVETDGGFGKALSPSSAMAGPSVPLMNDSYAAFDPNTTDTVCMRGRSSS